MEKYRRKKLKKKKRRKDRGLFGDEESYLDQSTVVNMEIGESGVNSRACSSENQKDQINSEQKNP